MALSLALGSHAADGFSSGMDANLRAIKHLDARNVERMSRTGTDRFREAGDADAHELALFAFLFLLFSQLGVTHHFQGLIHSPFVVSAVVGPAQRSLVGKLVRLDKISAAKFGRIDLQLVGQDVDHSLDQVSRFCDAERTAVSDSARRFVGVHAVYFAERSAKVIRTSAHAEQSSRKFGGLRRGVERSMVGQRFHAQGFHLAVLIGGNFCRHVIVAGKAGGLEILGARLNPLHGHAQREGSDNCADITGIDGDFVAKPAANVRRDYTDILLWDTTHESKERAVSMWRLR